MNPKRRKRLMFVGFLVAGIGIAVTLALNAFKANLLYFFSPTQVVAGEVDAGQKFRMGGLVQKGSVKREGDGLTVEFIVTDLTKSIPIHYTGILPDLFREGQGIVAMGRLNDSGIFIADEVLAKHDENYMPPEVAEALKNSGANIPHTMKSSQ